MNKKSIKKLAVAIEKINYLYGNIKKNKGKTDGIELVLLKRYATELYDKVVEIELLEMAANKKLSDDSGVNVEDIIQGTTLSEAIVSEEVGFMADDGADVVEEEAIATIEERKEYIPSVETKVDPEDEEIWEPAPKVVLQEEEPVRMEEEEEVDEEDVLERVMREQQLIIDETPEELPPVEEMIVPPVEEVPPPVEEMVASVEERVPPVEEIVTSVEEDVPPVEEPEKEEEELSGFIASWSNKVSEFKESAVDKVEDVKSNVFDKKEEVEKEIDVDMSEVVEEEVATVSKVWEEQEAVSEIQQLQKEVVEKEEDELHEFFKQQAKHQPTFDDTGDVSEGVSKTKVLSDLMETNPIPPLTSIEEKIERIQEEVSVVAPEPVVETPKEEVHDFFRQEQEVKSVADQLGNNHDTVSFPISFNQRFAFINQLFDGDTDAYNRSIADLGNSKGYIEALTYINLNLRHDYKWQDDDPVVKDFLDMIKKKFLG